AIVFEVHGSSLDSAVGKRGGEAALARLQPLADDVVAPRIDRKAQQQPGPDQVEGQGPETVDIAQRLEREGVVLARRIEAQPVEQGQRGADRDRRRYLLRE